MDEPDEGFPNVSSFLQRSCAVAYSSFSVPRQIFTGRINAESLLTVIGGRNGQGKTSILDAIAWALGGESYRPSNASRDGSVLPPKLHVELDNGIVVDRGGKNSSLTVTDPTGKRAGQKLLDEFVEKLALDLPKFMGQSSRDKAKTLLKIIGMEDEIKRLDDKEQQLYNRRHALGQIADQKKKYAQEMQSFPGVPEAPVSAGELIERQQAILLKNAENQRKRQRLNEITFEKHRISDEIERLEAQMKDLAARIDERKKAFEQTAQDEETARTDAAQLQDESTAELEQSIAQVDEINRKVRANLDKEWAVQEAEELASQYAGMSAEIEAVRDERVKLLQGADLPLPELTVEQGELFYKGKAWDCMSSSEQLRVSVAIVRAINPKCQFVLIDRTEAMDADTLREFGEWLEQEGLQAICTRVATDGTCQIIIEDGTVVRTEDAPKASWTKGVF